MLSIFKNGIRAAILFTLSIATVPANAAEGSLSPPFDKWLRELKAEAISLGVSKITLNKALNGVKPIPRIIELDRRQPEFTLTLGNYFKKAITPARISKGKEMLKIHSALLERVFNRFGVQPRFIVAFWGLESNFGKYTGSFPVVGALVTLSHDRRRAVFFRQQLLAVLQLIDSGHFPFSVQGSWAGAMGNHQFIPTTYRDFAVDFDGDGRQDLWKSLPDIFASAANYLSRSGWEKDRTWGREVELPKTFNVALSGLGIRKSLREWSLLGIRRTGGQLLPNVEIDEASLLLPAGYLGPAFLVYKNYRTTMVWNRSHLYALAVGHLADRLVGKPPIQADLGDLNPLPREQIRRLQLALNKAGYKAGKPDGQIGPLTRRAIKAYQKNNGLAPDGFPNSRFIDHLKSNGDI